MLAEPWAVRQSEPGFLFFDVVSRSIVIQNGHSSKLLRPGVGFWPIATTWRWPFPCRLLGIDWKKYARANKSLAGADN
jgi:hypothetical protein